MKLKVCGMRETENIGAIASLSPDYVGFIFYRGSKRFVGEDFEIPKDFPATIKRVGVFVNEDSAAILKLVVKHSLDFVQLHGEETVEQCAGLKMRKVGVIKVFPIAPGFDFKVTNPYAGVVDYFLFDAKGIEHGGNGIVFDWEVLNAYNQKIPFFLSGGLSPANVDLVKQLKGMNIHSLDVNSGVEVRPGVKDVGLVRRVIETM
jgi:phosphoribosylanthranilate isomerase